MSLSSNVIATLCLPATRSINFEFNKRLIAPMGYYIVAAMVSDGRIACAVDGDLTDRATYNPSTDTISASDNSYGEMLDEKSVLIHECTHAMLDTFYVNSGMSVLEDEAIAYLAAAIFSLETNLAHGLKSPAKEAVAVVRPILEAIKQHPQWGTGCVYMKITEQDARPLLTAIQNHPFYTDHADDAVHNGLLRPKPEGAII